MKIGRYRIFLGSYNWFQTKEPVVISHFLFFTIVREARPWDLSRKKQFPLGTVMNYEGKQYKYSKASSNIRRSDAT